MKSENGKGWTKSSSEFLHNKTGKRFTKGKSIYPPTCSVGALLSSSSGHYAAPVRKDAQKKRRSTKTREVPLSREDTSEKEAKQRHFPKRDGS